MATLAQPHATAAFKPAHWSQRLPKGALDHIPGEDGWPVIGTTLQVLADPPAFSRRMLEAYGRVYRVNSFGTRQVMMVGPEANELVLFDRDKIFSSEQGWGPVLDLLFPRGLMLLDFDHHRIDRRALQAAFKPEPMRHYCDALNRGIAQRAQSWQNREVRFYDEIKQLSLDLAADSFLGLPLGEEADMINHAFVAMVQASVGVVRRPVPFTAMGRGVAARRQLVRWFTKETLARRADGGGQDMFSQFARAETEDGRPMAVDRVVDHMIFLMMAAHDTITSSASTLVWELARDREWQDKLRTECMAVTGGAGRPLNYDDLGRLELTEMAFKEALRITPPVPSMPRRALAEFTFQGHRIPAGTPVGISPGATHHLEEYWPEPQRFDPTRFTPDRIKARHKYAWVPFGGGAHMCIGLHFAYMQIKILTAHLLTRYRIEAAEGYEPDWQYWPIPKARDGLQITLKAL